jgi:hypothetical protein
MCHVNAGCEVMEYDLFLARIKFLFETKFQRGYVMIK